MKCVCSEIYIYVYNMHILNCVINRTSRKTKTEGNINIYIKNNENTMASDATKKKTKMPFECLFRVDGVESVWEIGKVRRWLRTELKLCLAVRDPNKTPLNPHKWTQFTIFIQYKTHRWTGTSTSTNTRAIVVMRRRICDSINKYIYIFKQSLE